MPSQYCLVATANDLSGLVNAIGDLRQIDWRMLKTDYVSLSSLTFIGITMTQLAPIRLDDGTVIYIEATDDIAPPLLVADDSQEEVMREFRRVPKGVPEVQRQMVQNFQAIEGTIRAYTTYTLNAFRQVAIANIDKVTLEFGIKVGGEMGVPYITKGAAESNLKITVECSFPQPKEE